MKAKSIKLLNYTAAFLMVSIVVLTPVLTLTWCCSEYPWYYGFLALIPLIAIWVTLWIRTYDDDSALFWDDY